MEDRDDKDSLNASDCGSDEEELEEDAIGMENLFNTDEVENNNNQHMQHLPHIFSELLSVKDMQKTKFYSKIIKLNYLTFLTFKSGC